MINPEGRSAQWRVRSYARDKYLTEKSSKVSPKLCGEFYYLPARPSARRRCSGCTKLPEGKASDEGHRNGSFTHDKDLAGVPVRGPSAPSASIVQVKRFVEKQPDGATLPIWTHKVSAYSSLSRKDKESLIEIIRENSLLCVTDDGRTTTLHHPKFGHKSVAPVIASSKPLKEATMNKPTVTPEELRKAVAEAPHSPPLKKLKKAGDRAGNQKATRSSEA